MGTKINLPELEKRRVVIIGGGFAGLTLSQAIDAEDFQVVLLDRNNYHQFQPLLYQVAMAGLEPSSIVFPFRKLFQRTGKYFRMVDVISVEPDAGRVTTSQGVVNYDYLVIAMGSETHYFGNPSTRRHAIPMKSVAEALYLRNRILEDCEKALTCTSPSAREGLLSTVIVGGGPTGVELAGALAEMKKFVLPKDYAELPVGEVSVILVEGNPRLLKAMSEESSTAARFFLEQMGVKIMTNTRVVSFDGQRVILSCGQELRADKVIWAAGVTSPPIPGLNLAQVGPSGRLTVDRQNRVKGYENIFAIGDIALMEESSYPNGHPQVASVAIDQAKLLAKNLKLIEQSLSGQDFSYANKGSMATVGRHAAVADIGSLRLSGITAWMLWLVVHLRSLLGVKNKLMVMANWIWSYVTYDQPLRIIIRPLHPTLESQTHPATTPGSAPETTPLQCSMSPTGEQMSRSTQ